jgi:hypothetical protein
MGQLILILIIIYLIVTYWVWIVSAIGIFVFLYVAIRMHNSRVAQRFDPTLLPLHPRYDTALTDLRNIYPPNRRWY